MTEETLHILLSCARQAISKGFHAASIPMRRYGAAVLTQDGNIYSAGQYSSYNHITSIHAEMGAILLATMNNEPEIIALALAGDGDVPICSCGVCLQFMAEHCSRTHLDMMVAYDNADSPELHTISELTKGMWPG